MLNLHQELQPYHTTEKPFCCDNLAPNESALRDTDSVNPLGILQLVGGILLEQSIFNCYLKLPKPLQQSILFIPRITYALEKRNEHAFVGNRLAFDKKLPSIHQRICKVNSRFPLEECI